MNQRMTIYLFALILLTILALFASCTPLEITGSKIGAATESLPIATSTTEAVKAATPTIQLTAPITLPPTGQGEVIEAVVTPTAEATSEVIEDQFVIGQADVEQIEISTIDVEPVQVTLIVQGQLADGCTEIGSITHHIEESMIRFDISTQRPTELVCIQALVPFEQTFPIDVSSLSDGTYTVTVNGVTTQFMLAYGTIVVE